jgi:hypothetical protein
MLPYRIPRVAVAGSKVWTHDLNLRPPIVWRSCIWDIARYWTFRAPPLPMSTITTEQSAWDQMQDEQFPLRPRHPCPLTSPAPTLINMSRPSFNRRHTFCREPRCLMEVIAALTIGIACGSFSRANFRNSEIIPIPQNCLIVFHSLTQQIVIQPCKAWRRRDFRIHCQSGAITPPPLRHSLAVPERPHG